jgi:hypothetical protein
MNNPGLSRDGAHRIRPVSRTRPGHEPGRAADAAATAPPAGAVLAVQAVLAGGSWYEDWCLSQLGAARLEGLADLQS